MRNLLHACVGHVLELVTGVGVVVVVALGFCGLLFVFEGCRPQGPVKPYVARPVGVVYPQSR